MLIYSIQLAEAILLDDDDGDASSILLDDARSRRISAGDVDGQAHERQLLVGNGEDEDEALEDEVRSFRSSASMDEDPGQQKAKYASLMNNASARMSHLEVHTSEAEGSQAGDVAEGIKPKGGNLAAKAGIILVCSIYLSPLFDMTHLNWRKGHTQHLYSDTAVHHHRNLVYHLCPRQYARRRGRQ